MSETLIQLFAKPPVAGKVKTRLIPHIGAENALAVYQHCLKHNIALIKNARFAHQIWLTDKYKHLQLDESHLRLQSGFDLGEKMYQAMKEGLEQYNKVILIGADCLDITAETLDKVNMKLDHHEMVVIPAHDGGYVLIAAQNEVHPEMFQRINWSTALVMKQTLLNAMRMHVDICVLNPLRDIDRVEDLQHYDELATYY